MFNNDYSKRGLNKHKTNRLSYKSYTLILEPKIVGLCIQYHMWDEKTSLNSIEGAPQKAVESYSYTILG